MKLFSTECLPLILIWSRILRLIDNISLSKCNFYDFYKNSVENLRKVSIDGKFFSSEFGFRFFVSGSEYRSTRLVLNLVYKKKCVYFKSIMILFLIDDT